jgi:glycosyltransferase 2 family protein
MSRSSNRYLTILGLVLSAALLVFAFWDIDFAELGRIVLAADGWLLALAVLLHVLVLVVRGWRWHAIVSATERVPFFTVVGAIMVGHMANHILPARGGEVVRVFVLGRQRQLSKTMLLGSLVVDHTLEGVSLVLIMLALPFMFDTPAWLTMVTLTVGGISMGFIVAGVVVLRLAAAHSTQRLRLPASWLPVIDKVVTKLGRGLMTFLDWRRSLGVVGIGLLAWLIQGVMACLCLSALHLSLDFPHALFVVAAVNVAALVPGAPGAVGPFELAAIVALGAFGVAKTPGLSFGLLFPFVQIAPTVVMGFVAMSILGMRVSDLGSKVSDARIESPSESGPSTGVS